MDPMIKDAEKIVTVLSDYEDQLSQIERLVNTIDEMLTQKVGSTKPLSMLDAMFQKVSPLKMAVQNMFYFDLKVMFPNILWSSVYLTLYSIFEHALDDLCSIIKSELNLKLSPTELRDRGIIRSETYLRKIAQLDFPADSEEWKDAKVANSIRNCLTHAAGIIDDYSKPEEIRSIVRSDANLSELEGEGRLVISKEYVLSTVGTVRAVFKKITGDSK